MSENKTDSYSQAIDKINQLRALKFMLMDKSLTSDDITIPKILDTINMLEQVENQATEMLEQVSVVSRELYSLADEFESGMQERTWSEMVAGAKKIASDARNMASKAADRISDTASKVANSVSNTAKNVASSIQSTAKDVANAVTTQVSNAVSGAQQVMSKVADSTSSAMQNVKESASNLVDKASTAVKGAVDTASNCAKQVMDKAGKVAGDIGKAAVDAAKNIGEATSKFAGDFIENAQAEYSNLAQGVKDVASSVAEGAANAVSNIAEGAKNAASDIVAGATEMASNAIDAAKETGSAMMDFAKDVADNYGDAVKEMANQAAELGKSGLDAMKDFAENAQAEYSELAQKVADKAKDFGENYVDACADMAKSLNEAVGDACDDLLGNTIDGVNEMSNTAKSGVEEITSDQNAVNDYSDKVDDFSKQTDINPDELDDDEKAAYDLINQLGEDDPNLKNELIKKLKEMYPGEDPELIETRADLALSEMKKKINGEKESVPEPPFNEQPPEETPPHEKPQDTSTETVPQNPNTEPPPINCIDWKKGEPKSYGWAGEKAQFPTGVLAMMHDGDQQIFNPYGHRDALWTTFSFRPSDTMGEKKYPQIAITPASFEALSSFRLMLDQIPYVVVKEYFFKNTASTMMNLVKKIMDTADELGKSASNADKVEAGNQGSADAKSSGNGFLDKVSKLFEKPDLLKSMVVDIPYILYCGLRKKLYGNTYIFPYIVNNSTIINQASNQSEWGKNDGSIIGQIMNGIQNAINMIGGITAGVMGSQAQSANLFPAPTWKLNGDDKVSFSFDLILINDHIVRARNNYICVNTIINNNRYIQKAILAFPGALYELWLPTGQRHLMCTGDFKLYPLGLNRKTPNGFFSGNGGPSGANFKIGTVDGRAGVGETDFNEHQDEVEVLPDAYKLSMTFTSCLANNLNTSIFQYYVKMTPYSNPGAQPPGAESKDDGFEKIKGFATSLMGGQNKSTGSAPQTPNGGSTKKSRKMNGRAIESTEEDLVEKFDEATYNKQLQKLKSSLGDVSSTSDSAVLTIRKANDSVLKSRKFLSKLYNAENNNLWYKPFEKEEYYTSLKPDYSQALRKQYGDKLNSLTQIDSEIQEIQTYVSSTSRQLSNLQMSFNERDSIIQRKVNSTEKLDRLHVARANLVDEMLQLDSQMISYAFDKHDDVVSVKRNEITNDIFKQVWNEKIMNSYERDTVQYMTSKEKERYFKKKVRELKKFDEYGVLSHRDWFFRVTVIDYIVEQMEELINLFKNCAYDDYETVYKVVRKLNLLQLDLEDARSNDKFNINRTNLFHLSDKAISEYTKIDSLLNGSTLYELFQSQIELKFFKPISQDDSNDIESDESKDKELLQEQKTEIEMSKRRIVRDELVVRIWGSEANLTKDAYDRINKNADQEFEEPITITIGENETKTFTTLKQIKDRIIQLKLDGCDTNELQQLLGAFANKVNSEKEVLVIQRMNQMYNDGKSKIDEIDDSVNAKVKI